MHILQPKSHAFSLVKIIKNSMISGFSLNMVVAGNLDLTGYNKILQFVFLLLRRV